MTISPSQISPVSVSAGRSNTAVSENKLAQLDASHDEDEDDGGDEERLEDIKKLLFDTYRV